MAGGSTKAVLTALIGNSFVTVAKIVAWFFSGSSAMLAEAIHSIADVSNQALLLVGIRHGNMPANKNFPLGQGQARYLWNLISAVGIFFIGFGVTIYHGISELIHPHEGGGDSTIAIVVLALALIVEGYGFYVAFVVVNEQRGKIKFLPYLKDSDDPTVVAVLLEDGIAVLGLLFALAGILLKDYLGSHIPDAIATIFIGILLGVMALALAYINGKLLIGTSAGEAKEDDIREFVESYPSVKKVVQMRTMVMGAGNVFLAMELDFETISVIEPEKITDWVKRIRSEENGSKVMVEAAKDILHDVGIEINKLENAIFEEFPSVKKIELEID